MSFGEICMLIGLGFLVSLAASLMRCFVITPLKIDVEENSLPPSPTASALYSIISLLYLLLCFLSFYVTIARYLVMKFTVKYIVDEELREQRAAQKRWAELAERDAYEKGVKDGSSTGEKLGYNSGYREGYKNGYRHGYKDGFFRYDYDAYSQSKIPASLEDEDDEE